MMNARFCFRTPLWAVLALLLAAALPAGAQSFGGGDASGEISSEDGTRSPYSDASLVSEVASVQPGEPFTVALRMTMHDGWHSYWINPGDSGQPTSIDWALPDGFTAGEIQWPHPHRIDVGPLTSYGYSDELFLLTEITPPEGLAPGTEIQLDGLAEWLICADRCLPAEADVGLTLPVRTGAPAMTRWQGDLAEARARQPRDLPGWTVEAARSAGSYALKVTPPDGASDLPLDGVQFYSDERAVIDHAAAQPVSRRDDGSFLLALQQSDYASGPAERLTGTLVAPEGQTWNGGDAHALRVDTRVDTSLTAGEVSGGATGASTSGASTSGGGMTLVWALLLAFGGGLLLNLMPCVFPVLSIKVLNFAQHASEDEDGASARRHGLVFGAGVVASFWVLAGLLLLLRAGGSQIGWGFQLQSPLFIAFMAMLFFGIGLNLLGVFEVGMHLMQWGGRMDRAQAEAGGYGGSFWSGVLATVVATPCTAPLMGAALGFALSLSAVGALAVFTALGAGMAAPYVLLSMTPRLLKRMPRPGAWMETLRQGLAFPMFATAVWLVWVFGQQVGVNGVTLLLGGLLLLAMAAWVLGRWDGQRLSTGGRLLTRGLATAAVAGAVAVALIGARYDAPVTGASETDAWQAFSPEKVEALRDEGRPVFVDFTAAWCLSCQVNKQTTLRTDAVRDAFAAKNVALVEADWTNRDPAITRALERHGRSGVPLYVLYRGDGSEPTLLPEVLTKDIVLNALDALPASGANAPEVAAR